MRAATHSYRCTLLQAAAILVRTVALTTPITILSVPASGQPPELLAGQDHRITSDGANYKEVHLAIHPANSRHMVVAAMKETTPRPELGPTAGRHITELRFSLDGGSTWETSEPSAELGHDVELTSDPWLAFGPGHVLYLVTLPRIVDDDGRDRRGIHVSRSDDGGRSWRQGTNVPLGDGGSYDKTAIAVDVSAGPLAGTVYVLASQGWIASNGDRREGPIIARSEDRARSFTVPLRFSTNNLSHNVAQPAVVLSDGTLVAPFFELSVPAAKTLLQHPRLWVLTSTDGADTASGPYLVAESVEAVPAFLTVDHSSVNHDRLYIGWTGQRDDRNIFVSRSDDRGHIWSEPVRVNSMLDHRDRRYKPMLAVNDQGVLGVAWRDSREDQEDTCTHIYFSASLDGGSSFLSDVRVSAKPTCADSWWGDDGEYFGLAAAGDHFQLVWADNRGGTYELFTNSVVVQH